MEKIVLCKPVGYLQEKLNLEPKFSQNAKKIVKNQNNIKSPVIKVQD